MIKVSGKIIDHIKVLHIDYWNLYADDKTAGQNACYVIYDDFSNCDENGEPARDCVLYFSGREIEEIA